MSEYHNMEKRIIREMEYLIALNEGNEQKRKDRIKKLSFQLGEIVLNNKEGGKTPFKPSSS